MVTELQTPRLLLRRWRRSDVEPMAEINADPEVMRYIADGRTSTPRRTAAAIAATERAWDELGYGLFAVEIRETGELAGFTGLAIPGFLPEVLPAVEIGWRLGRPFWGRGIATEAARAAARFAFEDVGLDRLVSIHQVGNEASARVMRKLGMRLDRETINPTCDLPCRVYALTGAEYRSTAAGGTAG